MTITEAIEELEKLREYEATTAGGGRSVQALDLALSYLRDREAHWQEQAEIAKKGGHGPGSDF